MRNLFYIIGMLLVGAPLTMYAGKDLTNCMRALERSFYREDLVYQAFSFYNVPQGLWVPIYLNLVQKSSEIERRLKKETANMVPNPIEYPMDADAARELVKKALLEAFMAAFAESTALFSQNAFYYSDADLQNMFNYIYSNQKDKFIDCFGEEKKEGK